MRLAFVIVEKDTHDVTVQDLRHLMAARDDMQLVPVVDLVIAAEFVDVAQCGKQARFLFLLRLHNITTPRNNSAAGCLFVKLSSETVTGVKIVLRTG